MGDAVQYGLLVFGHIDSVLWNNFYTLVVYDILLHLSIIYMVTAQELFTYIEKHYPKIYSETMVTNFPDERMRLCAYAYAKKLFKMYQGASFEQCDAKVFAGCNDVDGIGNIESLKYLFEHYSSLANVLADSDRETIETIGTELATINHAGDSEFLRNIFPNMYERIRHIFKCLYLSPNYDGMVYICTFTSYAMMP